MTSPPPRPAGLQGCERALAEAYDVALLDLDGVLYIGPDPVPGAAASVERARAAGMRCAFVTNNASRTPEAIAAHLRALDVAAEADDIVTSAQAAARMLADRLPPDSRVLVVGGEGLRVAVRQAGLRAIDTADDDPVAVVQGYSADLGYAELAEAALAVRRGALWIASNSDLTIPSPRGVLPGNGALVAAVTATTGTRPLFAGKPEAPLHEEAVRRTGAAKPLVVGDRLDTDIEGAVRGGADSLLVLTGVTDAGELLAAPAGLRPSYLSADLSGLLRGHPASRVVDGGAECGGWRACRRGDRVALEPMPGDNHHDDGLDALRALCVAVWSADGSIEGVDGDRDLLESLGLK